MSFLLFHAVLCVREVANSASALIAYIARCVSLLNNHQIEDVLIYVVDGKIDIND